VLRLNVLLYWVVEKIRVEYGNGATRKKCCARLSVALAYHARYYNYIFTILATQAQRFPPR